MATKVAHAAANTYQATAQDLDDRINDLTSQLAKVKAEQYERSLPQPDVSREQTSVYYDAQPYDSDSRIPSYTTEASSPNDSREIASTAPLYPTSSDVPPPPYTVKQDRIPLPVVLPQTSKSFRGAFYSPFVRAYVPELEAHGLSQSDFLTFVDGLNEAFVANPVFEGLGIAGAIMQQFYGIHPVQWAGIGLQVASGAASAATSYARTRAYVKAVNASLFHPVGLHVNIMTTKKMMAKVGHPEERLSLPPLDTTDQLDNNSLSLESSSSSASGLNEDARMRRVRALQGYVMPLDFDVPAAVKPDNVLKRMGAAQARRQARKQEKKDSKRLEKALEKRDERLDKADEKIAEIEKDLAKEKRKRDKELGRSKAMKDPKERRKFEREFEKEERKLKENMEKAMRRREKKVEKHGEREGGEGVATLPKLDKREEETANKIRRVVISCWEGEEAEGEEEDDDESTSNTQARKQYILFEHPPSARIALWGDRIIRDTLIGSLNLHSNAKRQM
ncbi:hypothetical protein PRZ48_014005 [Zasmidium cellare]|uniref:Uncharacterized protein n=1 Tax=Zasmidium cellare TaxID=395010 RepID=A0ABR0DZR6_ZASCE|nr:hypothetical protein PRZ48_014005 [Zasmidium cellare]